MPRVVIDHQPYERPGGETVLDALRALHIHVPALCHDDRIAPAGVCRTCLVKVTGSARLVPACTTPLADGMEIEANGPELEEIRRSTIEALAREYPSGMVDRFPEKEFHREVRVRGVACGTSETMLQRRPVDHSHPYITVDMARCIECYRCVRICAELQGQFVWHVRGRGMDTTIEPDGPSLRESSCVGCGACVDTCPTGALEDRSPPVYEPEQWTRTTCPYCGVGCELNVGTRGARITSIHPVLGAPVSRGHLCVKGRYAFEYVSAADRITEPMIRDGGRWRRASWNEARAFVTDRLHAVVRRHGPDSVGILGSARATNEDNYVAQKFARAVIGTNNVDCCARVCHAPSAAALKRVLGAGFATSSFSDIERARTILVCGANPTENHPIVGARIRQAVMRGTRLIVIDPRHIELATCADCHLAIKPGTNIAALNAMAHTIVAEGLCDLTFIERRVAAFDDFRRFIEQWPADRAAEVCGVDADDIRRAARLYAANGPTLSVHGLGLTEHVQGTDGVMALINLALLTGNVGKPGAGINPLRGQNNVQGAAHMGCDPGLLPGSTPLEMARQTFEARWGVPLPVTKGLNALEMMDAAVEGRCKALWVIGWDVRMTNPNATETARALGSLDLVIIQDLFLTETAREYGSVFLPACSSFEKEGTFMNAERRIQRVRAALRPAGNSKPDWQILCELARAMGGRGFTFTGPEEIWNEVRAVCEGGRGMTYARLDAGGLQWPCPAEDHPGTPILHVDAFAAGPRAAFQPVEHHPSPEVVSAAYPLQLITGRSLYQFNAGTMTGRTPNSELRPSDLLEMSPFDAGEEGFGDGDRARVVSQYGSAVLPVRVNATIARGQLFATFQTPQLWINALTSGHRDSAVGTPEYKLTAVRVERLTIPGDGEAV